MTTTPRRSVRVSQLPKEIDGEGDRQDDRDIGHGVCKPHLSIGVGGASDQRPQELGSPCRAAIRHDLDDVIGTRDVERADRHGDEAGKGKEKRPDDVANVCQGVQPSTRAASMASRYGQETGQDKDREDRGRPDLGDNDRKEREVAVNQPRDRGVGQSGAPGSALLIRPTLSLNMNVELEADEHRGK